MAISTLHKYSNVAGKVPAAADLVQREIAINTADGLLYTKKANGQVIVVNPPASILPPLTASVNVGDQPVSSWSFTTSVSASVGQRVLCSMGGELDNNEFVDAFELEPLAVVGKVIASNTVQFVITTINNDAFFSGTRTVNFYLG